VKKPRARSAKRSSSAASREKTTRRPRQPDPVSAANDARCRAKRRHSRAISSSCRASPAPPAAAR
jgi:hypothetical protein